jgi:Ser/Thr protein kinase RdoA (MazF antagonist)
VKNSQAFELVGSADGLNVAHVPMSEPEAARMVADRWGPAGRATRVATEKDDTFVIDVAGRPRFVLKVSNPAEDPDELDFEIQLMHSVAQIGTVPVPALFPDRAGRLLTDLEDDAGQWRQARLMSFVAGTPLDATDSSPDERAAVGRTLARLRHATAAFAHPAQQRILPWNVEHLRELRPLLGVVDDPAQRDLLAAGLSRFDRVADIVPGLRRQVLHNDFSRSNLIVDHGDPDFVRAAIDFGDAVETAVAIDVSTALLNQLPRQGLELDADAFADGRDLLRGYLSVADLTESELAVIPFLVLARIVARALISLHRAAAIPSNAGYVLRNTEQGWAQLRWFAARSDDFLARTLIPSTGTEKS